MKKFILQLWFPILFLILCMGSTIPNALATDWYYDNAVTGSDNTGSTWANAWSNAASIEWSASGVEGGDTLWISGGSSGKVYTNDVSPPSASYSGSAGNWITIRPGTNTSHNGMVTVSNAYVGSGSTGKYWWINGGKDDAFVNPTNHQQVVNGSTAITNNIGLRFIDRYSVAGTQDTHPVQFYWSQAPQHVRISYVEVSGLSNGLAYADGYDWKGTVCYFNCDDTAITNFTFEYSFLDHNTSQQFASVGNSDRDNWDLATVKFCWINEPGEDIFEVDYGWTMHDNYIGPANGEGKIHCDGWQITGNYVKIYNNYIQNMLHSIMRIQTRFDFDPDVRHNIWFYNNIYKEYPGDWADGGILVEPMTVVHFDSQASSGGNTVLSNIFWANNTFYWTDACRVPHYLSEDWVEAEMSRNPLLGFSKGNYVTNSWIKDIKFVNNIVVMRHKGISTASTTNNGILSGYPGITYTGYEPFSAQDFMFDYNTIAGTNQTLWDGTNVITSPREVGYGNITDNIEDHTFQGNNTTNWPAFADPVNDDFELLSTDIAAQNTGYDMSAFFTTDALNRPRRGTWDQGALELYDVLVEYTFDSDPSTNAVDSSLNEWDGQKFVHVDIGYPSNAAASSLAGDAYRSNVTGNAVDFLWRTNDTYGYYNKDGAHYGIKGVSAFTNLSEMTIMCWARYNESTRVDAGNDWDSEQNTTLISAGSASADLASWDLGRFQQGLWINNTRFGIVTNSDLGGTPQDGLASDLVFGKSGRAVFNFPDKGWDSNGDTTNWHHYAVTFQDGIIKTYFDGVLLVTGDVSSVTDVITVGWNGNVTVDTAFIGIGVNTHGGTPEFEDEPAGEDYPNHGFMNGAMDEVKILRTALTEEEIIDIVNDEGGDATYDAPDEFFVSTTGDNSDGLTWATAWNEMNQISWGGIGPGDIVYIEGGQYSTEFRVQSSGTYAKPILILYTNRNDYLQLPRGDDVKIWHTNGTSATMGAYGVTNFIIDARMTKNSDSLTNTFDVKSMVRTNCGWISTSWTSGTANGGNNSTIRGVEWGHHGRLWDTYTGFSYPWGNVRATPSMFWNNDSQTNVVIEYCSFYWVNGTGIKLGNNDPFAWDDVIVRWCYFWGSGNDSIEWQPGWTVHNSYFDRQWRWANQHHKDEGSHADGIAGSMGKSRIYNNVFMDIWDQIIYQKQWETYPDGQGDVQVYGNVIFMDQTAETPKVDGVQNISSFGWETGRYQNSGGTQSGNTVTATNNVFAHDSFVPSVVGATIHWASTGADAVVTNYVSPTTVEVDVSQTVGSTTLFSATKVPETNYWDGFVYVNNTHIGTDVSGNGLINNSLVLVNAYSADGNGSGTRKFTNVMVLTNSLIANNIFYKIPEGSSSLKGTGTDGWSYNEADVVFDYNLSWSTLTAGKQVTYNGTTYNDFDALSTATSYKSNFLAEPTFEDIPTHNYSLASGDTAATDKGTNLASLRLPGWEIDLTGNSRIIDTAPDIGAIEGLNTLAIPDTNQASYQITSDVIWPLKASANLHYLTDQDDTPFLINGSSGWSLPVQLSIANTWLYLTNRADMGYNSDVWRITDAYYGDSAPANVGGDSPWSPISNDGSASNFTNFTEAYWDTIDTMLDSAWSNNIMVLAAPLYMGNTDEHGWADEMVATTTNIIYDYGAFLGERYQFQPNLIWVVGGDANPDSTDITYLTKFAEGIWSEDTNHLITAYLQQRSPYFTFNSEGWLTFNNVYEYSFSDLYDEYALAYGRSSPAMPAMLMESTFEDEGATRKSLRAQSWGSLLSGMGGQSFGNYYNWRFRTGWEASLISNGNLDQQVLHNIMTNFNWETWIPYTNDMVATGKGTFSENYVPVVKASDATQVAAFFPTNTTITVNVTNLVGASGYYSVTWYDLEQGTNYTASPNQAATGTKNLTPPSDTGWLLILDANASVPSSGGNQQKKAAAYIINIFQ